jgi:hypothetical protein
VYFEFEVSVAGNGRELDITWPSQDDVVRPREVNYLKCECLSAVVTRFSEGDRQGDLPKGDMLLTRDYSVEWVWAALELVPSEPQRLKSVKVHEVEAAAPSMRALVSEVVPTSGSTMRGNLPHLGMLFGWSIWSKVIGDLDQCIYFGNTTLMTLIAQLVNLSLRHNSWVTGPPKIDMTAFSSGKGIVAFPDKSPSDFLHVAKVLMVM